MKTSKVCFTIGMRNWIMAIWTLELRNLRTRSVTGICSIGTAVYANAGALDNAKALRTAASQTGSQWDAFALRGAPLQLAGFEQKRFRLWSGTSVRGRSGKHLPAVSEGHFPAIGHFRAVLGAIAFDRDLIAHFQGILPPPCASQNQRRAEFDIPIRHVAALILHVDIETGMRIHPLDLGDDSCELDRRVLVILSRKGMMRECRAGQQRQTQAGEHESRRNSSHC